MCNLFLHQETKREGQWTTNLLKKKPIAIFNSSNLLKFLDDPDWPRVQGHKISWHIWILACSDVITYTKKMHDKSLRSISWVTWYVSHVACHMPHVTCHISITSTTTAIDPAPANFPSMHSRMVCKDQQIIFVRGAFDTIFEQLRPMLFPNFPLRNIFVIDRFDIGPL